VHAFPGPSAVQAILTKGGHLRTIGCDAARWLAQLLGAQGPFASLRPLTVQTFLHMGVVSKHLCTGSPKWRSRQGVGKPQCGLLPAGLFSPRSLAFAVMADGIMGIMASTVSKSLA
jgi:hypothetical protein